MQAHNLISTKEYYDIYLKTDELEGRCKFCDKNTSYVSISVGYAKICNDSECKSKIAKEIRKNLRENKEKFTAFTDKVARNQERIWAERVASGEAEKIRERIGNTLSLKNSQMTDDELKEKYGWLNKLTEDEKEQWKNDVMFNAGMFAWWKTASIEQIDDVVKKRFATMLQIEEELIADVKANNQDYVKYTEAVWYSTNISYNLNKMSIDPTSLRSKDWHLDHAFSIKAGFIHNIDPKIIGSKQNLRIISQHDNCTKGAKCSITLEQLLEDYENGKQMDAGTLYSKK